MLIGAFASGSMCPIVSIVVHNIYQVYFNKEELYSQKNGFRD